MKVPKTSRGFLRLEFKDCNGDECSIQESSVATEARIWLGQNTGTHHWGTCMARMHLNQKQVERLIPMLQYFVDTGYLPEKVSLKKTRKARRKQ